MARKRPTASNVAPPPLTCIDGGGGNGQEPVPAVRVVSRRGWTDSEQLSRAVWALFDTLQERVNAGEERGRSVVGEIVSLRLALTRLQRGVDELTFLQDKLERRVDALGAGDAPAGVGVRGPEPCPLSTREVEVLACLAEGKVYKQIALELSVSASTVRSHLHNVYGKLGTADRAQAVLLASRCGWL